MVHETQLNCVFPAVCNRTNSSRQSTNPTIMCKRGDVFARLYYYQMRTLFVPFLLVELPTTAVGPAKRCCWRPLMLESFRRFVRYKVFFPGTSWKI